VPFLSEWRIACRFYLNGGLRAVSIRMADCVPFLSEWRIACRFYQNGGLRAVSIRMADCVPFLSENGLNRCHIFGRGSVFKKPNINRTEFRFFAHL